MKKVLLLISLLVYNSAVLLAQGLYSPNINIPVTVNGSALQNPWVGGFNAPIFSQVDMNGDGIKDLFVFEKDGINNRITTYINDGTPGQVAYRFAPEYRSRFPKGLHDWVLLKDFNCDGKEDIFTYSYSGGMTVYRNDYSVSGGLSFSLAYTLVNSKYGTVTANLYVASVNLPALNDIDGDGDLDVLTFSLAGNFVEYHKNKGKELFNRCDTLIYQMEPACYGNFGLSGLSNSAILNAGCRMNANPEPPVFAPNSVQLHSGSCMISLDIDGDADHDLINGDILGNNLLMLTNGGDPIIANMTAQDTAFPSYDVSVNMITFPSPYYMDVDNDGNKDLVVAPCIAGSAENFNNVWMYRNTTNNTTNVFDYQQNRFLSSDMIEVGAGANAVLHDVDGDGLTDMLIGNYGYFSPVPPFLSKISYYRNVGSATQPAFDLVTDDYGNFSGLGLTGLAPAFGDLDSDGDFDLLIGNESGTMVYYKNTAGAGNIPVYALAQVTLTDANGANIDVGQFAAPQIVDVNKDGKLDLLVGEKSGNLNYYENTGTPNMPAFTLATNSFGGVLVNNYLSLYGYSYPVLHDSSGVWQLLVGSVSGYIYQYTNISGNLTGTFNLVDSIYYGIHEPERVTLAIADLNGDGYRDILTGNIAGGVTMYDFGFTGVADEPVQSDDFTVFPNPTDGYAVVRFDTPAGDDCRITVYDVMGREIYHTKAESQVVVMDLNAAASGMYSVKICRGENCEVRKLLLNK